MFFDVVATTAPVAQSTGDVALNVLAFNAGSVYLIELLKKSKAPVFAWISTKTPWVTRACSIILATLTAAGFTITYDHAVGTLTIQGLTLTGTVLFLYLIVKNYIFQSIMAKAIAKPAGSK